METKEYFEKVMQDFNQHRNGRSLRKYCQTEGIDYWQVFCLRQETLAFHVSANETSHRR